MTDSSGNQNKSGDAFNSTNTVARTPRQLHKASRSFANLGSRYVPRLELDGVANLLFVTMETYECEDESIQQQPVFVLCAKLEKC